MEWMILPFKRYADFKGRSRRKEYWMFILFYWIVTIALGAILLAGIEWETLGSPEKMGESDIGPLGILGIILMVIWYIATFIPALAVTVRRLHDRGLSGWWYAGLLIAGFVPLINMLILPGYLALLVFLCLDGEPTPNKWGPSPKDLGQASVFR